MTESTITFRRFRSQLIRSLRRHFESSGFEEALTPLLVPEVNTEPHIQYYRVDNQYLIASPELGLKDFLFDLWNDDLNAQPKIFQLSPVFRAGPDESSRLHANEFYMAEYYHPASDLEEGIGFYSNIIESVFEDFKITTQPVMQQLSVRELFFQRTGQQLDLQSTSSLIDILCQFNPHSRSLKNPKIQNWNDLFFEVYVSALEPWIQRQEFLVLTHFPRSITSMARPTEGALDTVDRFEVFFRGIELCNGYIECFRPDIIRAQMETDQKSLQQDRSLPQQWLKRLEANWLRHEGRIPSMCGVAFGVERLGLALYQQMREGPGPGIGVLLGRADSAG